MPWDVEPTLNSGAYTQPRCECRCFESAVMTAIRAAPTASRVRATITSLSLPLATLFSPNLLLAEWLADKWRFLFFASGLYRVWQRRRWTLLRNVWKLLSAFFFPPAVASCTIYTWVSHTFHLTQGEKTEFTKRKKRNEGGEPSGGVRRKM